MSIKVSIDVNFEISLCVLKECASALATHKGNKQEKIVILCI